MGTEKIYFALICAVNRLMGKVAPTFYIDEIEQHLCRLYNINDNEHRLYHEICSEYLHIDIHIISPNEGRPFYLLHTMGMSICR